jgi:23S rRNA (adenine2503-C2)-methyltransferase
MGIGEPFDNFENMKNFLNIMIDQKGLAIGSRRITVSTSGIADKMYEFADTSLRVNLALSLHAPNNELRTKIMKINRAYPLEKLMDAINYYIEKTNQRITIEYILLKDVNDHVEEANELAQLFADKKNRVYINLIPYNPVDEHSQYQRSTQETVLAFYDTLKKQGINCKIRQEHGTDIDAACGQLRSKQIKKDKQTTLNS